MAQANMRIVADSPPPPSNIGTPTKKLPVMSMELVPPCDTTQSTMSGSGTGTFSVNAVEHSPIADYNSGQIPGVFQANQVVNGARLLSSTPSYPSMEHVSTVSTCTVAEGSGRRLPPQAHHTVNEARILPCALAYSALEPVSATSTGTAPEGSAHRLLPGQYVLGDNMLHAGVSRRAPVAHSNQLPTFAAPIQPQHVVGERPILSGVPNLVKLEQADKPHAAPVGGYVTYSKANQSNQVSRFAPSRIASGVRELRSADPGS